MTGRRRALVVAVDEYTNPGLQQLAAPTADALVLVDALSDADIADFDVEVVVNQPSYVTRHRVETFLAGSRPDDLTLLLFCGLGITDDRGALFLAGTDTRPEYVRTSALDVALVRRALARCRARLAVLVLDCRLGTAVRSGSVPLAAGAVDVAEQLGPQNLAGGQRRVLVTASTTVEFTFEDDRLQAPAPAPSSALTEALVESLSVGGAHRDGGVLLDELCGAALARIRTQDSHRSPQKWEFGAPPPSVAPRSPPPAAPTSLPPPPPRPRAGSGRPRSRPGGRGRSGRARPHRGRRSRPRSSAGATPAMSARRGIWAVVAVAVVGAMGLGFLNAVVSGARRPADPVADAGDATGGPAPAESLTVALCEPFGRVPAQTTDACSSEFLSALFSPLVEYDPANAQVLVGHEAPRAVAERVESQDQQTWTITLKEGWTFHDGTPVTAQSYVDAWNYHAYRPNGAAWGHVFAHIAGYDDLQCETDDSGVCIQDPVGEEMRGLTAVDDRTIEVTLSRPFSQFPLMLTMLALAPLPERFYDDPLAYEQWPVGNGPFQMGGEWDGLGGAHILLTRYHDYPSEPAAVDSIEFQIEPDMNAAYDAVVAGQVDVVASVPGWRMVEAESESRINYVEGWSSLYVYLGFPLDDDRFADPKLRKAISMAIDRQAIIDLIASDYAPADAFVPPGIARYRGGECGDNCTFDPQRAKRLLDEAGGFEGTMTLWTSTTNERWMEQLRDQLRDNLGLTDIEIQTLDFTEYQERLESGEISGLYSMGWFMDYPSPENYLSLLSTDGPSSYSGWSNRQFERLMDKGHAAPSIEESLPFYAHAQEVAVSEMPNVPLFFGKVGVASSDRVSNVRIGPTGQLNWADMSVAPRLPNFS